MAPRPIDMLDQPTFSPFELGILEEHADEAAFLWSLRAAASTDSRYDLDDLCRLDERVEARLDGLRLAESTGWEVACSALALPDAGVAFTAAVLALERFDLAGIARVLDTLNREPSCLEGVIAALDWVPFAALARVLPGLLSPSCPPGMHHLGIAACALHRRDPGRALRAALGASDPHLRARALMAAGELGRGDLRIMVRDALAEEDEACRFAAGFAGVLLGEPEAVRALMDLAEERGPFAERAGAMAVRRMPVSAARPWLFSLGAAPGGARVALHGAAALGDLEMVPWLLERMAEPGLARLSGAALTMITGADFRADKLAGKAPGSFEASPSDDPADDDVAMDADEGSPWPEVEAVKRWWGRKRGELAADRRHLGGRPLAPEWLEELLRSAISSRGRRPRWS